MIARGIRYRPGRSVVVLLLAMAATAAAVLTPAYGYAAEQSLLTDELNSQNERATQLQLFAVRNSDVDYTEVPAQIGEAVDTLPAMQVYTDPVEFIRVTTHTTGGYYDARALLAYRQDVCDHLVMVDGDCQAGPGEVLLSKRSAEAERFEVGDSIGIKSVQGINVAHTEHEIVGIYEPADAGDQEYWGRSGYFSHGPDPDGVEFLDAMFVTQPQAADEFAEGMRMGVDYQLNLTALRDSDIDAILAALGRLEIPDGAVEGLTLTVDNNLTGIVEAIRDGQAQIRASVPIIAVPLLLLCWFVLYLVMARLTEERAPEIGLAKLRGLRYGSVTGFALGEALLLIVAAVPLGLLLGLGIVQVTAALVLAEGTSVTLRADVFGYAGLALIGSLLAVLAATRRTLRRPVLDLLQRVPGQTRWRAGLLEGGAVALAVAATAQVLLGDDNMVAMLAPALLAVVAGLATARILALIARVRLRRARRVGSVRRMLAMVQLARRTEHRRIVVLLTIAVTLLTFGVAAWDMSEHNRRLAASDALGADVIYQVDAANPGQLMDVVSELDPAADGLMGVMRTVERYGSQNFLVVAAQTDRMAEVMRWRDQQGPALDDLARQLHPPMGDPVLVEKSLRITATVEYAVADRPLQLSARIVEPGRAPRNMLLGPLEEGRSRYSADLIGCFTGCRLIGLGVARYPGDFSDISFALTVESVRDVDGEVPVLGDGQWHPTGTTPDNVTFDIDATESGLSLAATAADVPELIAEFQVAPAPLPAVLAGPAPYDDPAATRFRFPAAHGKPQHFEVVDTASVVPRGGTRALLVDLEYTERIAETFIDLSIKSDISYEVWATQAASVDLAERLESAGLTVLSTDSRLDQLDRMSRQPPALALRLYLLAGAAALVLAVGAVALTSAAGSRSRRDDDAALRLSGVPDSVLRRSMISEYGHWVGLPLVTGAVTGLIAAWLVLPSIPLITSGAGAGPVEYRLGSTWVPGALAAAVAALLVTVAMVWRSRRRGATPDRLRGGRS
ncbi:FtsX-like permease family protein [Stackebrandtia endophytica]|uniref:FtsX-like permease family protein n=1 Tax=Stackebrandtia endophytica TaxID=1496996 RepID=UPI0024830257|nr:FtsX-like permease family protein [Stackebrandtia endophytica]